jgi:hypothetical protein
VSPREERKREKLMIPCRKNLLFSVRSTIKLPGKIARLRLSPTIQCKLERQKCVYLMCAKIDRVGIWWSPTDDVFAGYSDALWDSCATA